MRERPDLTFPLAPDVREDVASAHLRQQAVRRGGMNLRKDAEAVEVDEYKWPEAGPSRDRDKLSSSLNASTSAIEVEDGSSTSTSLPDIASTGKLGPFGAKLTASVTGAVVVSLLMNPFDVIKTRLQTVQPPSNFPTLPIAPPLADECCQTTLLSSQSGAGKNVKPPTNPLTCINSSTPAPVPRRPLQFSTLRPAETPAVPPSGCLHPSKWAGIWGEAVTLEEAMARNLVGLGANGSGGAGMLVMPNRSVFGGADSGFWSEIASVRRETGVRGLWKGVGTAITMSIPSAAIYMLGYEKLLSHISPMFTSDTSAHASSLHRKIDANTSVMQVLTPAPLVAGSLARTISATVISPIEMFRIRLQALPRANQASPSYASTLKDLRALVNTKGVTILWRGLGPTLWRDVPFSGLYWAGFEIFKTHLSITQPTLNPLTASFISGALSGTLSALVTQPFDVLKTRRQVFTPSPNCSPAALNSHASTFPLAMHVIRTEGFGALMAGLTARCGKVAPACGLMIASYEGVGRWLRGE